MKKKNTFVAVVAVALACVAVAGVYFLSQDITPQTQQISKEVGVESMTQAQSDTPVTGTTGATGTTATTTTNAPAAAAPATTGEPASAE